MSKAIAAAGVNISTAEVKTAGNDGRALSLFELKVTNAAQLNNLMHSIAAIDGVIGSRSRPAKRLQSSSCVSVTLATRQLSSVTGAPRANGAHFKLTL